MGYILSGAVTTEMTFKIGLGQKRNWAAILSRGKEKRKPRNQVPPRQAKSILVNINPGGGIVAIEKATAA